MKKIERIETETENVRVEYFDEDGKMGDVDFDSQSKEIQALQQTVEVLRDLVVNDLKSLWNRIDELEKKIKE